MAAHSPSKHERLLPWVLLACLVIGSVSGVMAVLTDSDMPVPSPVKWILWVLTAVAIAALLRIGSKMSRSA